LSGDFIVIGIVGYGVGNVRSVVNALDRVGARAEVVDRPSKLARCSKILLPGVGAFAPAMKKLSELGFRSELDEAVIARKVPLLGICLGMQLLADLSSEFGEHFGLGYVPGAVMEIPVTDQLRLPHMGWNDVNIVRECPLTAEFSNDTSCYFVHSFSLRPKNADHIVATTEYGGPIVAVIAAGNIFGTQFHPEKSQENGAKVLSAFAKL
jgi:imidazole glycerol-phosphate synthase subunit HisH